MESGGPTRDTYNRGGDHSGCGCCSCGDRVLGSLSTLLFGSPARRPPPLPPASGHGAFGEGVAETVHPVEEVGPVADRLLLGRGESPSDGELAALAYAVLGQLQQPPEGSASRATCLLLHRAADGQLVAELAMEVLGIPAEITAATRLLLRHGGRSMGVSAERCCAERLVCARDSETYRPPLPRTCEFLLRLFGPGLPVVCAWRGDGGRGVKAKATLLGALFPWSGTDALLSMLPGSDAGEGASVAGREEARSAEPVARHLRLFELVREEAKRAVVAATMHLPSPDIGCGQQASSASCRRSSIAAGALFNDGPPRVTSAVASGSGTSGGSRRGSWEETDVVVQLAPWLGGPELLVICDEFGMPFAPSGVAREYLAASGLCDLRFLAYDPARGELVEVRCGELWEEQAPKRLLAPTAEPLAADTTAPER